MSHKGPSSLSFLGAMQSTAYRTIIYLQSAHILNFVFHTSVIVAAWTKRRRFTITAAGKSGWKKTFFVSVQLFSTTGEKSELKDWQEVSFCLFAFCLYYLKKKTQF